MFHFSMHSYTHSPFNNTASVSLSHIERRKQSKRSSIHCLMSGESMSNSGQMQRAKPLHWLPPGWMVEVIERPSGSRDKVYIDPMSGFRFRSKPEVLRYLGIMEPSTPKKRDGSNVTGVVEFKNKGAVIRLVQDGSLDDSLDWLPFNWQVELTERKNGRVDRYYIHPVTGFKFRSKKEVSRYLQHGEMPKLRGRRKLDDAGRKFLLPSVRKVRKLAHSGTRRGLFTEQRSNTSKVENNKRVPKLSDVYASEHCFKDVGMQCYNVSELGQLLSNIGDSGNRYMDHACASKEYIVALSVVSTQKRKEHNNVGKSGNKKPKSSPQETENGSVYRVPCRTSRRLAGLEPELPAGIGKGEHLLLTAPTAEVDTNKDIHSVGGAEQPNEPWKTYEEGAATANLMMKLVSVEPELKITLPRPEGDTEKYEPSLGGEEKPNELGKASKDKGALADYPLKLAFKRPEKEITFPRIEVPEKEITFPHIEVNSHGGEEKSIEVGKTSNVEDVPTDCPVKVAYKGPETEITTYTEKVMHSLGREEKDSGGDNLIKLAFKESKCKSAMPRIEVDRDKDMHLYGVEEKLNELGETCEGNLAPTDYAMNFAIKGPHSGFTLPFDELSEFTIPFGEPSLDPCLEFAYKTLTGIIPIENLPIKDFLPKHASSVSTQDTGCLNWQDLHSMANLSLD